MKWTTAIGGLGLGLLPAAALAHAPGALVLGWVDGFRHPLLGWDHLLAMLAAGAWAAQQRGRARLAIPSAFAASLALGGVLGLRFGALLPPAELAIGVSVLALGVLAGRRSGVSPAFAACVAGSFGLAHGIAHGAELPSGASFASFGGGMLAASLVLQGLGGLVARLLRGALAGSLVASAAAADEPSPPKPNGIAVEEIVVTGRSDSLVGAADSASQGTVGAEQLALRPVLRTGEILETVPGVIVTQHAGGGKANQYFLRGFNLDHGTDFATSVDGVPVNLPSHGHGQGYTDLNFVIPELVERVNYRKGVYFADVGDFSSAGAVDLQLADSLEESLVRVTGGRFGYGRGVVASSAALGGGTLVGGVELMHDDGPWKRGDDYFRQVAALRFSHGDGALGWSATLLGHHGEWGSSDQIARSAVPAVGRFGSLDDSTGGDSHRVQLAAELHRSRGDGSTRVTAYALHYALDLFSDFTYFATDPVLGDQFEQRDERWVVGAKLRHAQLHDLFGFAAKTTVGLDVRHDDVDNGLFNTVGRRRTAKSTALGDVLRATVRRDAVRETSMGVWLENEVQWSEHFRSVAGLRGDWFRFVDDDARGLNSGARSDALPSPKLTLVAGPWADTELYLQGGLGFHSNDARGVNTRVDPVTLLPVQRAKPLVRTQGAEGGIRTAFAPGLHSTASIWWLDIDSELVFVGDAGTTEAGRPSRRWGIELANYWDVNDAIAFDADVSWSRARFRDAAPEGRFVPGAIETVVAAGMTWKDWHGFFGSVRLRYFGPRPLIEDDSVRSHATVSLGAQLGYRWRERWSITVDAFNLLNRKDSDIDYFYESAISPTAPLREEIHFHPVEPISARVTLSASF